MKSVLRLPVTQAREPSPPGLAFSARKSASPDVTFHDRAVLTRRHHHFSAENGLPMTTASPGGLAVATRGLTKRFGARTVVDHLDIAIPAPAGSVCGFVGPNGAGKTTTIRMLLGLIRPTEGTGTVLGQ